MKISISVFTAALVFLLIFSIHPVLLSKPHTEFLPNVYMFYFQSLVLLNKARAAAFYMHGMLVSKPDPTQRTRKRLICILMFESVNNHGGSSAAPPSSNDSGLNALRLVSRAITFPKLLPWVSVTHTLKLHIQ